MRKDPPVAFVNGFGCRTLSRRSHHNQYSEPETLLFHHSSRHGSSPQWSRGLYSPSLHSRHHQHNANIFRGNQPSPVLHSVNPLLAAIDLTSTAVVYRGFGFFSLLVSFLVGGLFFSSILAGLTAITAIGKRNALEVLSIVRLVVSNVWGLFVASLQEFRKALRLDGKWQWKSAWMVLKSKLLETRQVAQDGVNAVKSQAKFYAAAVGVPGLIPIQYLLDRLMPYTIASAMEEALKDALNNLKGNPQIRAIQLASFESGTKAPQLTASRAYELENAIAFDLDMVWKSNLAFTLNITPKLLWIKIPVSIQNLVFKGCVRVQLTPLTKKPPGFGAILVSFPEVPVIDMDIQVAGGQITKVPWLRKEIENEIAKAVKDEFLWPKRVVIPSAPNSLSRKQLLELQQEDKDPFRLAELAQESEQPILKEYMESCKPDQKSLLSNLKIMVRPEKEEKKG
ncbi:unnamed protein product [Cylindrotheca closterium]|uniref:SMP-LTD domain-containing protein n=1 Tax=Cylindrotheca closterium TaxID=2856 RepID=A0AAD2CMP8_9STRA|nr:unnamed protein product [Cylindrotheca closterium]